MASGLVSVFLTSYNRPRMVREAISSVLGQTYQNLELLILDDRSDLETFEVLSEFLDDPRVALYRSNAREEDRFKEARYARLINIGATFARGEFFTYLTDDDLYLPGRLDSMARYLNTHPEASVVYGDQKIVNEGVETFRRSESRVLSWAPGSVDHSSVMHRREVFEKVGGWPTHNLRAGDAEFWGKLNAAGYLFYPLGEVTDIHRIHEGGFTEEIKRRELQGLI